MWVNVVITINCICLRTWLGMIAWLDAVLLYVYDSYNKLKKRKLYAWRLLNCMKLWVLYFGYCHYPYYSQTFLEMKTNHLRDREAPIFFCWVLSLLLLITVERFVMYYSKKNILILSKMITDYNLLSKQIFFKKRTRWKTLAFLGKFDKNDEKTFGFPAT